MCSLKSCLLGCIAAGLLGTFAVAGCSASGDAGDFADLTTETDPTEKESTGRTLPPSSGVDESSSSASKSGTEKKDAGSDASKEKEKGPQAPDPGDACTTLDQAASRSCQKCGTQQSLCQEVDGKLVWSDYGPCNDETGVCVPGSTQACGNCGTQSCSNSCGWGQCTGQPQNSCAPGTVEYTDASCKDGGLKSKTCSASCTWGNYSATCESQSTPNKMTIPSTVGEVRSQEWTLGTEKVKRPASSCSGGLTTSEVRYVPVEISNPTANMAEISAYHTKSATGIAIDTVLWVYKGSALPMTDAELSKCVGVVADGCIADNPCGNAASGSYALAGLDKISIPPNGKILIYSAPFSSFSQVGDGTFVLNLRTDKLQ